MKKKLLAFLLAVSLTALCACGESKKNILRIPEDSVTLEPYDQVDLVYAEYYEDISSRILIGESLYTPEDIRTYQYESTVVFEGSEELAAQVLEDGKNPGLGVRDLHAQGITGEGVNVAIIDQNLLPDHPEYKDRIAAYYDSIPEEDADGMGSMHGPAVLSILAGETVGVAPGAKVYFAAAPSWKMDAAYFAECLYWIIEQNEALPEGEKIRLVSVSTAPEGAPEGETEEDGYINGSQWTAAVAAAEEAGILVIDCRSDFHTGFVFSSYCAEGPSDDAREYVPGYPNVDDIDFSNEYWENMIFAPASMRTTAQEYIKGDYIYTYWGVGGRSWAVPYVAGVLALGWQVAPELDAQTMKDLLFESAYVNQDGNHMIDPTAFIELVQEAVK